MQQDKIWDYFQNEGLGHRKFPEARQRYMLRYLARGWKVLNVGVGSGALERLGTEKGVEMYALDPSEKAIERLRQALGLGDRAQVGYAQQMPFDSDFFDVVVMSEVLEHLDNDILPLALQEVLRVLKPQGFLLASTPYKEDLGPNRVVCPDCGAVFHKVGHVQSFDKNTMRQRLEAAGFGIQRLWISTFVDWQRRGVLNWLKSVVRLTLARMGEGIADPHLIVIARKSRVGGSV